MPVMDKSFFVNNRQKIAETLPDSIVVLSAYSAMQRGNDSAFPFEQEANFWWLCGIEAPDWWIIIDTSKQKTYLVEPNTRKNVIIFDGVLSREKAREISGADAVLSRSEATELLASLSVSKQTVYSLGKDPYSKYYNFALNSAPAKMRRRLVILFKDVQDCRLELAKLRAIKQPAEITSIKMAIDLTVGAFETIKNKISTFSYEYEIEAELTHAFRSKAGSHAYDPIVASGKNACTLHYSSNASRLSKKDLVLIDAGARKHGYAADITRTYALQTPSKRQTEVHDAVLSAHQEIIQLLRPELSIKSYLKTVDSIMKQALIRLGLLGSDKDEKTYRRYFPHAISHGLGIDVHDSLGHSTKFLSGMVLTVEPGIYIPEESLGVRIEDDVLITDTGHTVLSGKLPTDL